MKKYTRIRLIIICAAVILSCACVEILSRYLYPSPWRPIEESALYYRTDSGFRLKPHRQVVGSGGALGTEDAALRTNSLGLRGPEPDATAHATILMLGDSITLADYIREEQTFVHMLQQSEKSGKQYINAGISTLGMQQEMALLKELLQKIAIDTVVLGFFLNDATGCCAPAYLKAPWPLSRSRFVQMFLHTYAMENEIFERFPGDMPATLQSQARSELAKLRTNASSSEEQRWWARAEEEFLPWGISFAPSAWQYYKEQLGALHQLEKTHGFAVRIIAFPLYAQTTTTDLFDYPQRQLGQLAAEYDWPYLDMLPLLRELPQEIVRGYFFDHCHYTPAGHSFLFPHIQRFLNAHRSNPRARQKQETAD